MLVPMSQRTRLIVELDPASDPVQGRIGPAEEGGKPFSGYVQLIAALEGYRALGGQGIQGIGADPSASESGYRGERVAST